MGHVCEVYLAHSKATDKPATFVMRGGFLFDFCTGLPARFWDKGTGKEVQAPSRADYLHKGYATREVSSILPLDVQSWLDKHKGWTEGTKRIAIQAVRRAMNYAREMKLIPENPIKGIKIPKANARITYLTPEQERAIAENTYKAFAILVYVCIRTGGRPISEVCAVTAKHVEEPPHGQIWRFRPKQHKTGHQTNADRLVFLPADVAEMVRGLAKRYPSGPLFRNRSGNPWTHSAAKTAFDRVRSKLADKGIKLDPDACLYSTRHTFAKRMLGGYWGEPVTLAVLAGLMNDRPDTCFKHYAKWSEEYTSPLFKAVNGTKKIT
jgi:integrase